MFLQSRRNDGLARHVSATFGADLILQVNGRLESPHQLCAAITGFCNTYS